MYSYQIERPIPMFNLSLYDWSSPSPSTDYRAYLRTSNVRYKWNDAYLPLPLTVNRWHINAWVHPILTTFLNRRSFLQSELWRAIAVISPVSLHRPSSTTTYQIQACLHTLYAFVLS